MKNTQAKQVKWDLVDFALTDFTETQTFKDYSRDEQEYALRQIKRLAAMLNVTDHIYL